MSKYGSHQPRKRFGQNFLHDRNIIDKIVRAIQAKDDQHIVEIGPGHGAITQQLIDQCQQLSLIEIDKDLVAELTQNLGVRRNIQIYTSDALQFDFSNLEAPFRLVGNLPYNISTPLLFHLLDFYSHIQDAHFMLQKDVVDRICATHNNKTYGRLSVNMQYLFHCENLFSVPPTAFYPVPKVQSAILRLSKKAPAVIAKDLRHFQMICKAAFAQRRKTLRNNMKSLMYTQQLAQLETSFDLNRRAETLSVDEFARLSNTILEIGQ